MQISQLASGTRYSFAMFVSTCSSVVPGTWPISISRHRPETKSRRLIYQVLSTCKEPSHSLHLIQSSSNNFSHEDHIQSILSYCTTRCTPYAPTPASNWIDCVNNGQTAVSVLALNSVHRIETISEWNSETMWCLNQLSTSIKIHWMPWKSVWGLKSFALYRGDLGLTWDGGLIWTGNKKTGVWFWCFLEWGSWPPLLCPWYATATRLTISSTGAIDA